jgi:hypothetical protein
LLWIPIYDPSRTPAHWTEIIRDGQYAVFIYDAPTHVACDAQGECFVSGAGVSVALCGDLTKAAEFARGVVGAHPELCCEIYDHEGKAKEPVQVVYNPAVRHKYEGLRYHKREVVWGVAAISVGIPFMLYDYYREFLWIWGYVIGLKLTIVGVVLLARGLVGCYTRRRERSGEQQIQTTGRASPCHGHLPRDLPPDSRASHSV